MVRQIDQDLDKSLGTRTVKLFSSKLNHDVLHILFKQIRIIGKNDVFVFAGTL